MVKYQFTSQDAEKSIAQFTKLKEIIDNQAIIINQLKMENDQLRLQLQKLSQQIDKTQREQQSNSDLLGINQNKVSSTLPHFQTDNQNVERLANIYDKGYNPFALNLNNQCRNEPKFDPQQQYNPFQNPGDSQILKRDAFSDLQCQLSQLEQEKASQQTNYQQFFDANNQPQQKQSHSTSIFENPSLPNLNAAPNNNTNNIFYNAAPDNNTNNIVQDAPPDNNIFRNAALNNNTNNIFYNINANNIFQNAAPHNNTKSNFCNNVNNDENQKQQINSQENHEQESLLFGDPSNCYYNVQKSESKALDQVQLFNQKESINDQDIKQLENSKENSSQNSSSFKASSSEKHEEFQIIEKDEESNSI
ncbi:unnamed protein product (macronuclear) [Paramecium tetraurelia]|uniref:Chromosome undetermined scaffold_1, whole genome shotgun sequence n=1 Tax=Paramecium tetraurelia TaxID=5888 RepID=Q6BFT5_PARTE|nr:hypothetical protein [Paramecium tetraurelia strain d4-2]XP_001423178.1 uncharacterized protein GSPATT00000215001 [Paramecium tetraurelia]CAH03485.1 hypothetical protein PTMB.287 [Paramecium tetraurelia]CAK55780.1 unnamed protein product [Paramecium tetraurelia]|eukprot:XP_001423178.1 hypothetical protein (macronuclear) [Paramecium tetraurelia strain d4-2]